MKRIDEESEIKELLKCEHCSQSHERIIKGLQMEK